MRDLLLNETNQISGGYGKPILDNSFYDTVKWVSGGVWSYVGSTAAWAGVEATPVVIAAIGLDVGKLAIAGSAGLVFGGIGFLAGKIFSSLVLERIGD